MVDFLRRRAVFVVVFAVVAALLVYRGLGRDGASHVTLPEYAVAIDGGGAELRADQPFEIALRPASSVTGKVVAYVFAIGEGEPSSADARIAVAPDGSVGIAGPRRSLVGVRELRVVVGAPTEFKRYEDALARARDGKSDADVRVIVLPITRVAR